MFRRFIMLTLTFIGIYIIISLSQSVYSLWNKRSFLDGLKADLAQKQAENDRLKEKLRYVQTNEFVEEEARNKFSLQRPGEMVVVIPETLSAATKPASLSGEITPHWVQWVGLFF